MILCYDIGTTHLKGAVVDAEGRAVAGARVPVRWLDGGEPLGCEIDPDAWLSGLALVTAQLGLRDRERLKGVVVSGNGPTLVAVDAAGEPVGPALGWQDRRAVAEASLVAEFSGSFLDESFYLPKALWMMRNRPVQYARTRWFLPSAECIDFVLTGHAHRVNPAPLFAELFWNESAIPRVGLDPDRFPPFVESGERVGVVRDRAADALGVPEGLPVFAGGPDFLMSILGAAATQPGRTCDRIGTSEGVNLCWHRPIQDRRLLCFPTWYTASTTYRPCCRRRAARSRGRPARSPASTVTWTRCLRPPPSPPRAPDDCCSCPSSAPSAFPSGIRMPAVPSWACPTRTGTPRWRAR
ncbi:MAG TPA: FGGY family carbohydrate kinase [Desulfobacterales bacterium]|nr:FGGY family carbohydrate kinase [Desulfobacterales bacterium]